MNWIRRIGVFMAVNLLVVLTISLVLNILGVGSYLTPYGLDIKALAIFCLIWGMGGAFISLALSRIMAKWMMGVKIVPADTRDPHLQDLVRTVHSLAATAQLPVMPEVGVYDSPEINAFATGPSKSRSLVAVSSGLLNRMGKNEVRGVLGHEVAHIANGDMVTMTLIQGVVNAFVMFLARVIAYALTSSRDSEGRSSSGGFAYYGVQMLLEIVFMIFGSMVIAAFSRYREFRADKGGASLAGRDSMIQALEALRRTFDTVDQDAQPALATLKISSRPGGIMKLFSTHPPLEERISRLKSSML